MKSVLNGFVVLYVTLTCAMAQALDQIPYYGEKFYTDVSRGAKDEALIDLLRAVLQLKHEVVPGGFDRIVSKCESGKGCYAHSSIGYDRAKTFLLGDFYLVQRGQKFAVRDVYCESEYTSPGPNRIPSSTIINVEHTWPQSHFTGRFGKDIQKSDLHHLFPTDSEMNSIRGNYPFGEVDVDEKVLKCQNSRFGHTPKAHRTVFEPPSAHKGNVARALFYFSIRYDIEIDHEEEAYLRVWHEEDPIDEEEIERNERIFKLQANRNPFIDHPELVTRIRDF